MECMISKSAKQKSLNDLNSFGGRLRDAREEAGLLGTQVWKILNGYLQAQNLKPVNINTFMSWERIGTPKEIVSGKSYPHPSVYPALGNIYGVTGYWLFIGGDMERYRKNVNTPTSTDYSLEQRKALTTEALGHRRVEIKFRKLLIGASDRQKRAIENLIDSMLDEET